jgi:hypothetical protein
MREHGACCFDTTVARACRVAGADIAPYLLITLRYSKGNPKPKSFLRLTRPTP